MKFFNEFRKSLFFIITMCSFFCLNALMRQDQKLDRLERLIANDPKIQKQESKYFREVLDVAELPRENFLEERIVDPSKKDLEEDFDWDEHTKERHCYFVVEDDIRKVDDFFWDRYETDTSYSYKKFITPLNYAVRRGNIAVIEILYPLLSSSYNGTLLLHYAILSNNLKVVSYLLNNQFKIDVKDFMRRTPLHYAVAKKSLKTVELLYEYGADLSVRDRNGSTPLHYASAYGYGDIRKFLISKGADDEIPNYMGYTPALYFKCFEVKEKEIDSIQFPQLSSDKLEEFSRLTE